MGWDKQCGYNQIQTNGKMQTYFSDGKRERDIRRETEKEHTNTHILLSSSELLSFAILNC